MPDTVPETKRPEIYSIAAHRGFADALAAGLWPRYREGDFGLARLTLLLPSSRAARTMSEAFIRLAGTEGLEGMLMPRMVVIGDLDLDETLGPLFDPLGEGVAIPPAVDPTQRMFRLAQLIREERGAEAPKGAALLRLAAETGQAMDRLLVEDVDPADLVGDKVLDLLGELSKHWEDSLRLFARLQARWLFELGEKGMLDAAARRNRLFEHAARKWREKVPETPIIAAGITSAAPALARLLRTISELPQGAVVLPDLDLTLGGDVWDELGLAGAPDDQGDVFARGDALTHPQYHLKLLLNRMGVNRSEVQQWHRAGLGASRSERSHAISALFLPPEASKSWVGMKADQRRLSGVRIMECAHPEEEAQAIALMMREALEVPERRVALVTPDRGLAGRVAAHLQRWNIQADDTAGRPLSQSTAGRLLLLLAEVAAERAAPVPLVALLTHPLVAGWDAKARADWLDMARDLDLALRGPRPGAGLDAVTGHLKDHRKRQPALEEWWAGVAETLAPLLAMGDEAPLDAMLDVLISVGEALCGEALWAQADGRALSQLVEELRLNAGDADLTFEPRDLPFILRDAMDRIAVRPPWGGHPRVAIYGLLESRMSRADLVICGGMTEGNWPANPSPDPLLPPAILRALGVPAGEFRIGLAAHDLAAALGAPEVVMSHSRRDADGAAIPSRFVLRAQALLGELFTVDGSQYSEERFPAMARVVDHGERVEPHPRPQPMPSPEQRKVAIQVTALDRLRSDPYQFYASSILRLSRIDALDAEPTAAMRGTAAHDILERWHKEKGDLAAIATQELAKLSAHPLMRALWQPRLMAALEWVETELSTHPERRVVAVEERGRMVVDGVEIIGRADRIDTIEDETLAIVDYKTGSPPTAAMVQQGFALQLGLIGMMVARGGIANVQGEPSKFEYWSLGRDDNSPTGFGYIKSPVKTGRMRSGVPLEDFLPETERYLREAIARWINGDEPFTARANPDLEVYTDYDQLMRLDEWFPLLEDGGET